MDFARRHPWLALIASLALTFSAAAFGAQFMPGSWYAALAKPALNPPGWLFGLVWPLLYVLMSVAAWLLWRASRGPRRLGLALHLLQLVLNALWSWFFFGLQQPLAALVDLLLLWLAVLLLMLCCLRSQRAAAILLLPYLLWLSFAFYLNAGIVSLNPGT